MRLRPLLGGLLVIAWVAGLAYALARDGPRAAVTPSRILRRCPVVTTPRDLSAAAQEYLLALRVIAAGDGTEVTAAADRPPSRRHDPGGASEMFRRLSPTASSTTPRAATSILTTAGRAAADAIFRRHALLEWLLTSVVGLGWAELDEEAMRLQGAISPRVEARLDEMLGHPETCPHGNPIDAETATPAAGRDVRLSEIEAGYARDVYRITEEAEEDAGPALVSRGPRADARRPDHDPRPLRVARLAHARRPARPGDPRAFGPAALVRVLPGEADPGLFHRVPAAERGRRCA